MYILRRSKQLSAGISCLISDLIERPAAIIDPVEVPPIMSNSTLGDIFDLIVISNKIINGRIPRIPPPSMHKILILCLSRSSLSINLLFLI